MLIAGYIMSRLAKRWTHSMIDGLYFTNKLTQITSPLLAKTENVRTELQLPALFPGSRRSQGGLQIWLRFIGQFSVTWHLPRFARLQTRPGSQSVETIEKAGARRAGFGKRKHKRRGRRQEKRSFLSIFFFTRSAHPAPDPLFRSFPLTESLAQARAGLSESRGLKVNQVTIVLPQKSFSLLIFCVVWDHSSSKLKDKNISRESHRKCTEMKSEFLLILS